MPSSCWLFLLTVITTTGFKHSRGLVSPGTPHAATIHAGAWREHVRVRTDDDGAGSKLGVGVPAVCPSAAEQLTRGFLPSVANIWLQVRVSARVVRPPPQPLQQHLADFLGRFCRNMTSTDTYRVTPASAQEESCWHQALCSCR